MGDTRRILWHSNSPWAETGYGVQTALFVPRIQQLGYDVGISSTWGLNGAVQQWNGITVFPCDERMGNVTLPSVARHWAQGEDCLTITLQDVWTLNNAAFAEMNMACWVPIDHDPAPPMVVQVLKAMGARPIAMSRFGETALRNAGLDPLYVPHGVDMSVFRPCPERRPEVRELLGFKPDDFVIGMVAANKGNGPPRKSFPQVFEAFARFERERPDAFLYLHTELTGKYDGCDIPMLAEACGIPPRKVKFTPQAWLELGVKPDDMASLYSVVDVLANPSYGEGFGVPIIEAQACGIPVIVSDFTAMPELCGAGWLVNGDRWWDPRQNSFFKCPSVKSIHAAFRKAYKARADQGLRERAVEFAQRYDADRVAEEHWKPVLEVLTAKPEPRVPQEPEVFGRRQLEQAA